MSSRLVRLYALALACMLPALAATPAVRAADLAGPVMLVAKPEMREFYGRTVLFARPIANGQHVGFIINRPTPVTLGKLFPDHAPSQKVVDPVYLGGPVYTNTLFALVHGDLSPGGRSVALLDNLYLASDTETVDRIIEHDAAHARFIAGLVAWQPGELDQEVRSGFWFVLDADVDLVFRKSTDGMWEELVRRSASGV
ncbi:MAG: YqgE/AlgH family protein [Burkholderiales bacterium]